VENEVVCHSYPVWLHGMSTPIVVAAKFWIIEISYLQQQHVHYQPYYDALPHK